MKSPHPRLKITLLALLLLLLAGPIWAQSSPDKPELRAFWVDGFNDGFKTPAQCDLLLSRLRTMHANAVFVQMRKRADAYYASHYEGWAQDDPTQFDALAYLCAEAHAPGKPRIQIHAWINACAVGGNQSAGMLSKLHPEWLSRSDTGADSDGEATKIDPGNPQAADWTFRVYLDVVRHYDVDGIHLDFIRYGGDGGSVGHWGYNAVSVARYNAYYGTSGSPKWEDPRWQAWRRRQVTNLVRRIYVTATALKPKLVVSAATICWGDAPKDDTAYETKSASYTGVFAPWRDWMREGILDLNCPMAYFTLPRSQARWAGWNVFAKDRTYGRQCALGIGAYLNPVSNTLGMLADTRAVTAKGGRASGAVVYCYDTSTGINGQEVEGDTTLFAALPRVWQRDVPPPPMPWKAHPKTGSVIGMLLAGDGLTPWDTVAVTAGRIGGGVHRQAVTDGNGFFSFAHLPPGSYTLEAAPAGRAERLYARVRPGYAARLTIVTPGGPKSVTRVYGIGARSEGTQITLGEVTVTSGSDRLGDHFFAADGLGGTPIQIEAPNLVPPVIRGDRVFVTGTLHHTPSGMTIAASAVRLTGITP